jgi:hypothetical protein
MSKTIIAIDIGKHGSIVIRKPGFNMDTFHPMPMVKDELDYKEVYGLLANEIGTECVVIFEKLGVIFGTSKATAFSMGHQAGAVEMACIALMIPFHKITAKVWQKEMFQGTSLVTKKSKSGKSTVTDTKATALIVAKQLFPQQKLTFGDKATKPHDGLIDALLMAEYAKRRNL